MPIRRFLPTSVADVVTALGLATATRTGVPGEWELVASKKVGAARVGSFDVVVRPKVDMSRLVFLMGYAQAPDFWLDHSVHLDPDVELAEALATSFTRLATKALDQGLLNGYVTTSEALPVLRGRLRTADHINRRFGVGIPLEVTYDDFSVDIAENRLLLASVVRLLRVHGLNAVTRHRLQRLRLQLADVSPLVRGQALPRWGPNRLNARYVPALRLAELVLGGNSFEQRVGDLAVSGFVFDMWKIYEDFVCVALAEALRRYGGHSQMQFRTHLDHGAVVPMKPDLVWSRQGVARLVVDAKYKAEKPAGFPQADLYQLLAYCTVLGLSEGHLVYAQGEDPRVHQIVGAPVTIHCHTLDLDHPPRDVLHQVEQLAARMIPSVAGLAVLPRASAY